MKGRSRFRTRGRTGSNSLLGAATAALGVAPLHYWDFTTNRALFNSIDVGGVTSTPGWSFTRASTGYANQTPNAEFGSQNLVLQSQTFDNASWAKNVGATASGTAITFVNTGSYIQQGMNTPPIGVGSTVCVSFTASIPSGSQTLEVRLVDNGDGVPTHSTNVTVTSTPTAFVITQVLGAGYTTGNQLGILFHGNNVIAAGTVVTITKLQVELGTTPTTYKPTTTVAVTDVSGPPLVSFGSGVLRRTNKGALIEGAGTNIVLQSQTFDNASWTKTLCTVTANALTAPDGTLTADKVITDNAAVLGRPQQVIATSAATVYTVSCYAKAGEWGFMTFRIAEDTAPSVWFNLNTGVVGTKEAGWTSATIQSVGGGWYRCTATHTTVGISYTYRFISNNVDNGSSTGDGTSGIYLWGAQLEASSFASSYIPTTTASATRAADVLTVSSPGVTYPLSLFAEFERVVDTGGDEHTINAWFNLSNNAMLRVSSTDLSEYAVTAGGATVATETVAGSLALATTYKHAVRVQTNDFKGARGGTLTTGDTVGALPTNPTSLSFGARADGILWSYGYIRRAAVFSSALNDAQLQRAST